MPALSDPVIRRAPGTEWSVQDTPRHLVHADEARLDEWWSLATNARPMTGLPVLRVKTDEQVDVEAVAAQIALLRNTEQALPA